MCNKSKRMAHKAKSRFDEMSPCGKIGTTLGIGAALFFLFNVKDLVRYIKISRM